GVGRRCRPGVSSRTDGTVAPWPVQPGGLGFGTPRDADGGVGPSSNERGERGRRAAGWLGGRRRVPKERPGRHVPPRPITHKIAVPWMGRSGAAGQERGAEGAEVGRRQVAVAVEVGRVIAGEERGAEGAEVGG